MHGLGGKQSRRIRPQITQPHGAVTFEQRMDGVVTDPRLVPEDVVAEMADLLDNASGVVDGTVVRGQLDDCTTERALRIRAGFVLHQGVPADLLAQVVLIEGAEIHGAHHAKGVSRGRQVDRNTSPLHQRAVVIGLVIVAVEQDQVTAADHRVLHDLVRRAGAIEHEVGLVGPEHASGVFLGLDGGTLVYQQVAQVDVRIAEVVAEDSLSEVLEEQLPGRRFAVKLPALVPRAVEGHVGVPVIGHQAAEERRQQALAVFDNACSDLLGVVGGCLLTEVDEPRHFTDQAEILDVRRAKGIRQRPKWYVVAGGADGMGERAGGLPALAVHGDHVGAYIRILVDVAVVIVAELDRVISPVTLFDQIPGLRILGVGYYDNFQVFGKRDGVCGH